MDNITMRFLWIRIGDERGMMRDGDLGHGVDFSLALASSRSRQIASLTCIH
jgi:hypothetical protein